MFKEVKGKYVLRGLWESLWYLRGEGMGVNLNDGLV